MGSSPAMASLRREIAVAAQSSAKVLITGESGVGKDMTARVLHRQSTRRSRPFRAINCASVPDTLLESELFGHVRGSFTGAVRDHRGVFESAHGGTVVLDEIGDSSPRMQGLLLRFLQFGELQRIGETGSARHVDVRVVATTQPEPARSGLGGRIPTRSVLSPERHSDSCAAAAGEDRGPSDAGRAFHRDVRRPVSGATSCSSAPTRWRGWRGIRGLATCANCGTSSNGSSSGVRWDR